MVDPKTAAEKLRELIENACSTSPLLLGIKASYPSSRWQSLRPGVWVKREDELSFTLSGPKFRKFCGLHKALEAHSRVVSWGSARSAFLLGLAQICREMGKELDLVLLQSTPYQDFGTDVLYQNAFNGCSQQWLSRDAWSSAPDRAREFANDQGDTLILPEGGACQEGLAGALSLALDLTEQFQSLAIPVEAIWIDAGSGFTAQALIWGLGTLMEKPPLLHVVLCAGNEKSFREGLSERGREAQDLAEIVWKAAPYRCHRPVTAAAYGATNRAVWDKIAWEHQQHGLLLDPLYTAKLLLTFEAFRQEQGPQAKTSLVVHSGGALNNFGFKDGFRARQP